MPDIADTIKEAVKQAIADNGKRPTCAEHAGLMGALAEIKRDTSKIPALDKRLAVHEERHASEDRAADRAAKKAAIIAAQSGTWAKWGSFILAGAVALAGAVVIVVSRAG